MSFTIQTGSKVLCHPAGSFGENGFPRTENELFWFVKIACNNVTPFRPRWQFKQSGWNYSVVSAVCRVAGDCEGGMLKFGTSAANARDLSPEEYIADYRAVAGRKKLLSVSSLRQIGFGTIGFGNAGQSVLDAPESSKSFINLTEYEQAEIRRIISILHSDFTVGEEFGYSTEKTIRFCRQVEKVEDFLHWVKFRHYLAKIGLWDIHD